MSFSGHGFILMITSTAGKVDHLYAKIIVYICTWLRCFLLSSKLSHVKRIVKVSEPQLRCVALFCIASILALTYLMRYGF